VKAKRKIGPNKNKKNKPNQGISSKQPPGRYTKKLDQKR
jgi:hypothetical protein